MDILARVRQVLGRVPLGVLMGVLVVVAGVVMGPALLLLPASLPMADDYCVAVDLRGRGLWEFGMWIYGSWSGRVLSHVLIALPVWLGNVGWLGVGYVGWVGILNGVVLGLCGVGLVILWRVVLGSWRWGALVGLVGLAWLVWHWLGVKDAVFWYAAAVTYTVGLPLICLVVVGMVGSLGYKDIRILGYKGFGWWVRGVSFVVAAVGLVLLSSLNEPLAVLGGALAVGFLGYQGVRVLGYQDGRRGELVLGVGLAVVALVALGVLLAAPGNTVRVAASTAPQGLLVALLAGIPMGIGFVLAQVNVALLVWLGWVACVVRQIDNQTDRQQDSQRVRQGELVAVLGLMMVVVVVLTPALGLYANGESLALRTQNQMLYLLWLGLSLVAVWGARFDWDKKLKRQEIAAPSARNDGYSVWGLKVMTVGIMVVLVSNVPLMRAVNDLRRVGEFRASFVERERLLAGLHGFGGVVEVPTLRAMPKTVYEEGIQPFAEAWQNGCVAGYYGVGGVRVLGY